MSDDKVKFDSETAQDFVGRIQQMSGKNPYRMTSYAVGNLFERQRLTIDVDVLEHIQLIMDAAGRDAFISFNFNVYDVVGTKIGFKRIRSIDFYQVYLINLHMPP